MAGVAACFGLGPADGCCLTLRLHGELKKPGSGVAKTPAAPLAPNRIQKTMNPSNPFFLLAIFSVPMLLFGLAFWNWRVIAPLAVIILSFACQIALHMLISSGLSIPEPAVFALMALCPVVALDFLLCRLTQISRANIHLVLGILGLGLGLAASMSSQMPGGRELLYAQGFPWEDIVFFIAVCSLCESKNDYVWDNRGQFEEKERRAAAIKVQAESYARRRPLADVLSSGLGIFCTMLALLALVAWLFGLLGWPRLAPSFLAMAGPLWLGLHLGWHRHAPEQVSDVVFILYPQAWYPADVDAVVKRMGNLGHHPFASATNEVWLARILIRGLVILPIFVVAFVTGSPALGLHELGLLDNVPMLAVQGTGFCGVALLWPLGLLTGALLEALCGNPYPLAADLPRESAPTPRPGLKELPQPKERDLLDNLVRYPLLFLLLAGLLLAVSVVAFGMALGAAGGECTLSVAVLALYFWMIMGRWVRARRERQ